MAKSAKRTREHSSLPDPISVKEALRQPSGNIKVPDGQEMIVGPFNNHAKWFRVAEIRAFEDLHRLGFISEKISEERAMQALRADDHLYRQALRRNSETNGPCSCTEALVHQVPQIRRRHYQDHLIELLQPLYRQMLSADDPAVFHPCRQLQAWFARRSTYLIGMYVLRDIDIGRRATLVMTPTVRVLRANDINIGDDGCLRFTSGNVHARCRTLNGPKPPISTLEKHLVGHTRETEQWRKQR